LQKKQILIYLFSAIFVLVALILILKTPHEHDYFTENQPQLIKGNMQGNYYMYYIFISDREGKERCNSCRPDHSIAQWNALYGLVRNNPIKFVLVFPNDSLRNQYAGAMLYDNMIVISDDQKLRNEYFVIFYNDRLVFELKGQLDMNAIRSIIEFLK
jgi:hypothetical protein